MITNAKDGDLSNVGSLPDMSDAIRSWMRPVTLTVVTKTMQNFQLVETKREVAATAVLQPLDPHKLEMKPEGQRAWDWHQIHALPDLELSVDDIVNFQSTDYRILAKLPYAAYGYVEYHAVRGYKP